MANNRNRDSDSGNTPTASGDKAVFIDTSLDTHLAVIASDSDTVSDLKKKIMIEHPLCFPNWGDIKINALKVKRRRCLYHLSDSMLVKSAFEGAKKCWFISVDAFSLNQHDGNRLPLDCAVSNQLPLVCCTKTPTGDLCAPSRIGNPEFASRHTGEDVLNNVEMMSMGVGGEPWKTSFLDNNVRSNLGEIQETHVEYCNDQSRNTNGVVNLNDSVVEEEDLKYGPVAKKKRKRESKGNENHLEGNDTLPCDFIEGPLKPKDKILESSMEYKLNKKSKKKKNPNMASVAAIVSEINMQDADPAGTVEVPRKQKHHKSVQEVEEQDKSTAPSVGSLFREGQEVDHLVAGSSRGTKESRKKKKLPTDEAVNAVPSTLQDAVVEGCKENGGGIVSNDTHNASVSAVVSEQNDQRATLSVQEVVEGYKLPSSSMDSLLAKHTEDIHLVAGSSSGMKKSKRKKKLPTDEVVNAEPSFVHDAVPSTLQDAVVEGCKENGGGIVSNDTHNASVSAVVSEQNDQRAALSVQEVVEGYKLPSSSMDSLLAKHTEDIHLVAGSSSGMKKSKRKKLPTDEVVNAEPSFVHDAGKEGSKENVGTTSKDSDKASDSGIVSELNAQHLALSGTVEVSQKQKRSKSVQEVMEGNELPSSEGINASRPDAANDKGETDAPDSGARSRSERKKKSKKHQSTDGEGFPSLAVSESDNLKKDDMRPQHANLPLDYENFETCGPQKIEERKELPQNHDPGVMWSGKCEPPIHGDADMHSKESVVSDNLLESTIVESGKSAGTRLKMRAKKSVAAKKVSSSKEHDDNSVGGILSQVPRFNDHSTGEAKKEESFLSPTEKKKMSKLKTVDTSVVGTNGQIDDMCGNEAESLPSTRVDKTQENPETSNDNLRKNAEKNKISGAKTFADFPVKEQANEVESLQLNQKVDMTRKDAENMDNKSGKTAKKSKNSTAKSLPESSTKEQEIGSEVLTPNGMLQVVETAFKTKKETKSVKTSSKSRSAGKELVLETVPSSDTLDGSSIGGLLQHKDGGNASKNIKTTDANYEIEVSKCDGDSINFKDYFIPGGRDHEITPVKLVVDNVIQTKGSDKEMKTKKNAEKVVLPSPATSHVPGNSLNSYVNQGNDRRSKGVSKASSKKLGEVVNSLPQEKSSFAPPGAIFNGTSESSESESTTANSDSSTKSPSDYSSSSGFSEGDGKLDRDSSRNGTPDAIDKDGGKSITKSRALGSKNVTLDKILRSSSRFKKAKLTATQLQLEDIESQPIDFVPDSQANL